MTLQDLLLHLVPLSLHPVEPLHAVGLLLPHLAELPLQRLQLTHTTLLQILLLSLDQYFRLLQLPQLVLDLGDVLAVKGRPLHGELVELLRVPLELVPLVRVMRAVVGVDVDSFQVVQVTSKVGDGLLGDSLQPTVLSQTSGLPVLHLALAVAPEGGLYDHVIPELRPKDAVDEFHHGPEVDHLPDVGLLEGDHEGVDIFEFVLKEVDQVVNSEFLLPQVHTKARSVHDGDLYSDKSRQGVTVMTHIVSRAQPGS